MSLSEAGDEESDTNEDSETQYVLKFTRLHEKVMAGATKVSWCPKMDLVAVACWNGIGKNAIYIMRSISWEKLHKLEPKVQDARVTALTWSPDGRNIVTGFGSGKFALYDVESGLPWPCSSEILAFKGGAAVSCVTWIKYDGGTNLSSLVETDSAVVSSGPGGVAYVGKMSRDFCAPSSGGSLFSRFRDRTHRLVPSLDALPVKKKFAGFTAANVASVSSFSGSRSRSDRILGGEADPDYFDLIVMGSTSGEILVYAYGDLLCIRLAAVPADKAFLNIGVVAVSVAADFSYVAALLATNHGVKAPLPITQLLVYNSNLIRCLHRPLACAADHLREVWKLCDHMDTSIKNAKSTWMDCLGPITTIFSKINEAIAETTTDADHRFVYKSPLQSPLQELQISFTNGATNAIEQFFSSDRYKSVASTSALKRLHQGLQQGLDQCQIVVRRHIIKPAETGIFRLSELKGLVSAGKSFASLGISECSLARCIQVFEDLALTARTVLRSLLRLEYASSSDSDSETQDKPPSTKRIRREVSKPQSGTITTTVATRDVFFHAKKTDSHVNHVNSSHPLSTSRVFLPPATKMLDLSRSSGKISTLGFIPVQNKRTFENQPQQKSRQQLRKKDLARVVVDSSIMVPPQMRRPNISTEEKSLWSTDKTVKATQRKQRHQRHYNTK